MSPITRDSSPQPKRDQSAGLQRQTALQQAGIAAAKSDRDGLSISELGGLTLLRGQRYDRYSLIAGDDALPTATGAAEGDDPALLCLAPGEWLGVASSGRVEALGQRLEQAIGGAGMVRDVSDGSVVLRLGGPAAPWLLAKLSGLDFCGGRQEGPHCARTRIVDLAALVHFHTVDEDGEVFDLYADRSYSEYLWSLLQSSAAHAIELTTTLGTTA